MKKNVLLVALVWAWTLFSFQFIQAQSLDWGESADSFAEKLFYAYSFRESPDFELDIDASSRVVVIPTCAEGGVSADNLNAFLRDKRTEFLAYSALDKSDFGEKVEQWRSALPEPVYLALMKEENVKVAAQNNLCSFSDPFCTNNGLYEFPAGVNAGVGEVGPYYDCLSTRPNPAWYYLRILEPGDMDIYMYSTPRVDIDFCCWGPFDDPWEPCPNGLKRNKVVSCSYSTLWEETCEIRNAQQGDYYILLITNYSNRSCNIHFSKVDGDATTDCSILPPLLDYDAPVCVGEDLSFHANGNMGSSYHWFFVGGNWTSDEQDPVRYNATSNMSGTYGCAISRDGQQSDTTYIEVLVSENYAYQLDTVVCGSFFWHGTEYTESGSFKETNQTVMGCDSIIDVTIDMNYAPDFEIEGTHWPIGGSEMHISVNEYAIRLVNARTKLDTVVWRVDCDNWRIKPHGNGESCTLYIYSYLTEPVMLHATAINRCDTIHQEFFIQTSYHDVEEYAESASFEVSPNPTDGRLTLRFNNLRGIAEIRIFNGLGQVIDIFQLDTELTQEMTYTMPTMDAGLYYVALQCNGKTLIRKIVLENSRY